MTIDEAIQKIEEGIEQAWIAGEFWFKLNLSDDRGVLLTDHGKNQFREILTPFEKLRQLAQAAVEDARYDTADPDPIDASVKVKILEGIASVLNGLSNERHVPTQAPGQGEAEGEAQDGADRPEAAEAEEARETA